MNFLLLMMGGSGTRFGADIPKQYTVIDGRPLFSWILQKADRHTAIDEIVIVSHADWIDYVQEWCGRIGADKVKKVVKGGETRSESVLNGLRALSAHAQEDDVVLMHDATHPYYEPEKTEQVIAGVKKYGGATLGGCQYDTCYQMDENHVIRRVVPRQELVSGASPEGFFFGDIYRIYSESPKEELERMTSAGAIALSHDIPMVVIPTDTLNLKITHADDMRLFELLKDNYFFKKE